MGWGSSTRRGGGRKVRAHEPSLESLSSLGFKERNLGCPGNFARMSRTPGGVQKVCAKRSSCAFCVPSLWKASNTESIDDFVSNAAFESLDSLDGLGWPPLAYAASCRVLSVANPPTTQGSKSTRTPKPLRRKGPGKVQLKKCSWGQTVENHFSLNFCHCFGCGSDAVRMWLGRGSDVVRTWFGCGSEVVRMWAGGGSDVFSDLVQTVWQK